MCCNLQHVHPKINFRALQLAARSMRCSKGLKTRVTSGCWVPRSQYLSSKIPIGGHGEEGLRCWVPYSQPEWFLSSSFFDRFPCLHASCPPPPPCSPYHHRRRCAPRLCLLLLPPPGWWPIEYMTRHTTSLVEHHTVIHFDQVALHEFLPIVFTRHCCPMGRLRRIYSDSGLSRDTLQWIAICESRTRTICWVKNSS